MKTVGIIGAGNLGQHLSRLFHRNNVHEYITISDIDHEKASVVADKYGFNHDDNRGNILTSDIIFLTVKPNNIKEICNEINILSKTQRKLIVSTAAGVTSDKISGWAGYHHRVIRCMPNIPISVGKGTIIWNSGDNSDLCQNKKLLQILTIGPQSYWLSDEEMMDSATVLSGCIPAYIAKFYKSYKDVGIDMGFTPEMSKRILLNSLYGTTMLLEKSLPEDIIEQVASKGGATEKALEMMDESGFDDIIRQSCVSSLDKIKKITKSLD